jgi:protein involved in polysaccharide export with SLBB domain
MPVLVTVIVRGRIEFEPQAQRINQSGNIGLPLIQTVRIGNMDLEEAEKLLTTEYSQYYREPLVNVEFAGAVDDPSLSPWGYVTLMGNVASPGPIAMPPTRILTVSGAVKLAGGSGASAKKGSIRIYRPLPEEDSVEMIKVDLDVLGRQGAHSEDVRLQAGDVIYIPERIF